MMNIIMVLPMITIKKEPKDKNTTHELWSTTSHQQLLTQQNNKSAQLIFGFDTGMEFHKLLTESSHNWNSMHYRENTKMLSFEP
jgi:hypothetical protein